MKKVETDVLVIGAGLAGVAAALAARKAGKKVVVLARESGASAMSSGAIDIAGDPVAIPGRPEKWSENILENIDELLPRCPDHPYGLVADAPGKILEQVRNAIALVFPPGETFLSGDGNRNILAFNQIGTFKQTAFTQTRMLNLDDLKNGGNALVVGFSGFRDFDTEFFKKNFLHWTTQLGAKVNLAIEEISTNGLQDKSSLEVSRWVMENIGQVTEDIGRLVKSRSTALLILPPIIPAEKRVEFMDRLEKIYSLEARELLSLPPSVPGKRLAQYLEQRLKKEGVDRMIGRAASFQAEGLKVLSVSTEHELEGIDIFARSFVLAGGSFLAGGIEKVDFFKEGVFGLEIFCGNRPTGKIFTEKLTSVKLTHPQPLFSVGLKTDENARVLNKDGKVAYENLFAAGAILAGGNYIMDGTGAGAALASGLKAGQKVTTY
jgi:glycerol-3-phosphate dehydrogenase subunit B